MEDRLIRFESYDDETEYNLMLLGSRIALNQCMLATFRLTELTPLPPKVRNYHRVEPIPLPQPHNSLVEEGLWRSNIAPSRHRPRRIAEEVLGEEEPESPFAAQHRRRCLAN